MSSTESGLDILAREFSKLYEIKIEITETNVVDDNNNFLVKVGDDSRLVAISQFLIASMPKMEAGHYIASEIRKGIEHMLPEGAAQAAKERALAAAKDQREAHLRAVATAIGVDEANWAALAQIIDTARNINPDAGRMLVQLGYFVGREKL